MLEHLRCPSGIENPRRGGLHVVSCQDRCRLRKGSRLGRFAVMRPMAASLRKQAEPSKGGVSASDSDGTAPTSSEFCHVSVRLFWGIA